MTTELDHGDRKKADGDMRYVTRLRGQQLLEEHLRDSVDEAERARADSEDLLRWELLPNREYERELAEALGGDWCIAEWCPVEGQSCKWATVLGGQQ